MNALALLMLDDHPAPDGVHLTVEQRLDAFERWWAHLTDTRKTELLAEFVGDYF